MVASKGGASSSSAVICSDACAVVPAEPIAALEPSKGVAVPVKGNVFVDHIAGQSIITHAMTLEKATLDKLWILECTDDGLVGMLVSCADVEDQLDLDEVLKKGCVEGLITRALGLGEGWQQSQDYHICRFGLSTQGWPGGSFGWCFKCFS